jgi:hypothetical protein
MKRPPQQLSPQMNLQLFDAPTMTVPEHKRKELTLTLIEILTSAARENNIVPLAHGGEDESPEAQC